STGVSTDFDGNYKIKAKAGDVIHFTSMGLKSVDKPVSASTTKLDVVMEQEAEELDEVVVTSNYGGRSKDVVSAGVAVVGAETMGKLTPSVSVDNMLQGKAVGVDVTALNGAPGKTATIKVRGAVSLNTTGGDKSQPLYVVDGIFVSESDMAALNPADVETMSVLKDASSTAIYGSRGANGVILITTKQGKKGKAKVSYSGRLGFAKKIEDPFEMMNAEEKISYEEAAEARGAKDRTEEQKKRLIAQDHNWQDDILRTSLIISHALSFSGATDNGSYFISGGWDKNTGIIQNIDGFKRITGRVNFTTKLGDRLRVGVNSSISHMNEQLFRDRNNVQNPFRAMYIYNPYEPVYRLDKDGNPMVDAEGNRIYNNTSAGFPILEALVNNPERDKVNHFVGTAFAEYDIFKNFTFQTRYSGNYRVLHKETYTQPGSVLDGYVGDPKAPGSKADTGRQYYSFTWLNQLVYKYAFGEHNINASLFSEYSERNRFSYRFDSKGYSSKLLNTQENGAEPTRATSSRFENAIFSVATLAEYDFKDKYTASATLRRDGASRFGADKRYGTFWSLGLGWNLKKENFLANVSWLNNLKLTTSYGTVGNWNIPDYAAQGYYESASYNGTAAIPRSNVSNKELSWETQQSLNLGIESSFFNNRLSFIASYFRNVRDNFLFETPLTWEGGAYSRYENAGNMATQGLELSLSGDIVRTKDFKWSATGNITFVNYKINKLNGQDQIIINGIALLKEGYTPFTFFLPRYAGVDTENGDALYFDKEGKITNEFSSSNAVILEGKSPLAKYYGGFGTTLDYRGIELNADFSFKVGNYIHNYVAQNLISDGQNAGSGQRKDALNYWKKKGDNQLPKLKGGSNQTTDRFLQDGSYLRLRSLSLGYTMPKHWIKGATIKMFVQAENLYTFTKYEGDPEISIGSGENQLGSTQDFVPGLYGLYSYPAVRTITMGINVNF
ncbi:MAG: SusC/RagA family TonB-linked outer membrane protein, partial [Bacteroidota bacterium]|nr:SusC/RagA family TonB-linked outer membrane protein [Bacteroidota bacterium]